MSQWLLDTGPLVAFFDKSDEHHEWAVAQWAQARPPLQTCEAVLAEAAYLLHEHAGLSPDKLISLFERKAITSPFRLEDHSAAIARLLERYADRGMELADACLVRMSEINRDCRVFTLDKKDFQVYRRFERQAIPLIAPD